MVNDMQLTATDIPVSVQVLANHSSNDEMIPPGFAVIDTAALLGCAGDNALDQFLKTFNVDDVRTQGDKDIQRRQ